MWGVLLSAAIASGLVGMAATRPGRALAQRGRRLEALAQISDERLSLDQAEDGAVLARQLRRPGLEERFRRLIEQKKRGRT